MTLQAQGQPLASPSLSVECEAMGKEGGVVLEEGRKTSTAADGRLQLFVRDGWDEMLIGYTQ